MGTALTSRRRLDSLQGAGPQVPAAADPDFMDQRASGNQPEPNQEVPGEGWKPLAPTAGVHIRFETRAIGGVRRSWRDCISSAQPHVSTPHSRNRSLPSRTHCSRHVMTAAAAHSCQEPSSCHAILRESTVERELPPRTQAGGFRCQRASDTPRGNRVPTSPPTRTSGSRAKGLSGWGTSIGPSPCRPRDVEKSGGRRKGGPLNSQ